MSDKGTFFPLLSTRLRELREKHGYTQDSLAEELSKRWNEQGRGTGKTGQLLTGKTYKNYEEDRNVPKLETLGFLADFYGVSVDYLLGRSDYTEVSNELIGRKLGLKDNAIKGLEFINDIIRHEEEKKELFSFMLSSEGFLRFVLNFHDYIFCDYKVPIYLTENGFSPIPNSYLEDFDTWTLKLASSEDTPSDHVSVFMDDTFFMKIARDRIRNNLDDIKKEYLEEIEKQNEGKTKEHKKAKKKSARKK